MHFLEWKYIKFNKISLKFIPKCPIDKIVALVQIMAWHHPGGKPCSDAMMGSLLMHICIIWPQLVNDDKEKCICSLLMCESQSIQRYDGVTEKTNKTLIHSASCQQRCMISKQIYYSAITWVSFDLRPVVTLLFVHKIGRLTAVMHKKSKLCRPVDSQGQ